MFALGVRVDEGEREGGRCGGGDLGTSGACARARVLVCLLMIRR